MDSTRPGTVSKEMESENAMSSVRRCAFIRIESLEFIQPFESTNEIVVTMSMENRRSKKLISQRFSANNGEPSLIEINGEFQLFYSHNVKNHRDPILRFAVENTRAKTFTRHRSIAASLVSMQQVVQHNFDGLLTLYESHVTEKNPLGRLRVQIRSVYVDDDDSGETSEDNDQGDVEDNNDSSDGENQKGLARISRSIRSIFSSSGGAIVNHQRGDQRHLMTETLGSDRSASPSLPLRPYQSEDPTSITSPLRLRETNRYSVRHRSQNHFYHSDSGSQISSRTHSIDMNSVRPVEGQHSDTDMTSSLDSGNGEQILLIDNLQIQLGEFAENMSNDSWQPYVILLQNTPENKALYEYFKYCGSNYGFVWRSHVMLVKNEECVECILKLYSLYNEKITEHDLEPFRVLFVGDDSFLWYLLLSYLLLVSKSPNESFNLLFLPLLLSCSLTHYIACKSYPYLQLVVSFSQFIQALLQEPEKSLAFSIEQHLANLIKAEYSSELLAIHEVSLQRRSSENDPFSENPEIVQFLSNDQGKATKLKIPYLFSVSIGAILPFSSLQYIELLLKWEKSDLSASLPDLLSSVHYNIREKDIEGTLDYWLCKNDLNQVSFESKSLIKSLCVQRKESDLDLIIAVPTGVANKKKKSLVNKYLLTNKGKTKDGIEKYECIINKMMLALSAEDTICVDGISIDDVNFMTVSNRYFLRNKTFPICVPYVESNGEYSCLFYITIVQLVLSKQTQH